MNARTRRMAALVLLLLIAALGAVAVVAVAVRQPTATGPVLTVREYRPVAVGGQRPAAAVSSTPESGHPAAWRPPAP